MAAVVALAALTGCFGANKAAANAAVAAKLAGAPGKPGAYAGGGPIPISVTTRQLERDGEMSMRNLWCNGRCSAALIVL